MMNDDYVDLGDPANLGPSPNGNELNDDGPVAEHGESGDASMSGTNDVFAAPVGQMSEDPTPTPGLVVSDNPLDAPGAPRPQDDMADGNEDEDMGDAGDETKLEGESPEKDGAEAGTVSLTDTRGDRARTEQPVQTKAAMASVARAHLVTQTHSIVLPSYSIWFEMQSIHPVEKRALPEFFNNRNRSKTPVSYKDYRDFMINTYRLNPAEYLTFTACRRNLAGDVCALMRVHRFLEQWGLINYQVDADSRPSKIGPPFTGHFRIYVDAPRGLQPFQTITNAVGTPGKALTSTERALAAGNANPMADLNLELRRNVYDASGKEVLAAGPRNDGRDANGEGLAATNGTGGSGSTSKAIEDLVKESKKQYYCRSCGADCTRIRFHSSRSLPAMAATTGVSPTVVKYDLCPDCFLQGRFPPSSTATDFTKLEDATYSAIRGRDVPWTDTEMLLMLEGLEMFDENWNAISDHVGTRTREECILKFLQLEIEDKYLDGEPSDTAETKPDTALAWLGSPVTGRAPFSQADNPVMSVVAFLAGLVNPQVAASAAGRSAEEMRRRLRQRLERGPRPSPIDGPSSSGAGGSGHDDGESMDIDRSEREPHANATVTTTTTTTAQLSSTTTTTVNLPFALIAARAAGLAAYEERETYRIVNTAVQTVLSKLDSKMTQFGEMEALVQHERRELERAKQQLLLERLSFRHRVADAVAFLNQAKRVAVGEHAMDGPGPDTLLTVPIVAGVAHRMAWRPAGPGSGSGTELNAAPASLRPPSELAAAEGATGPAAFRAYDL
ncbi:MAG: hypothetical protein M1826_006689 [Phylliscum demangeonii]|nr:MAG: hypothetical protein M1826_006689 [Phylliscum demangeonii]